MLRIVSGLLFLEHGTVKLLHFPPMQMPAVPDKLMPVIIAAGVIELVGGTLVTLMVQHTCPRCSAGTYP